MFKLVAILTLATLCSAQSDLKFSAKLSNGSPVRGERMTSAGGQEIRAFKNIPYAEPPLGKLRFADPVPKASWTEELAEQKSGPIMCPQMDEYLLKSGYLGQEDCLVLNVYTPADPKSKEPLPVMFFIHGGGFMSGTGNDLLYGPEFFLDEDVVLVTANYRLAALGFLSTNTEELSGNYGLKDQSLALKWIQENIALFNGNSNRVTFFGESAGSSAVAYHLMSPWSKGLFHAAIMQSGNPFDMWAQRTPDETLSFAKKLFDHFGCEYSEEDYRSALECLREKDVKMITEAFKIYREWDFHPLVIYTPIVEQKTYKNPFVTAEDMNEPLNGAKIPLIIGNTANEGAFWVALLAARPETVADLNAKFEDLLATNLFLFNRYGKTTLKQKYQKIKDFYFKGKDFNWDVNQRDLVDLLTANHFLAGTSDMIRLRKAATADTFLYKFNYKGSASFVDLLSYQEDGNMAVGHADDLLYMFPLVQNLITSKNMSEGDKQMQKLIVKMWTNFAKTGNPSTPEVNWKPMKDYPLDYLRIGNCNLTKCDLDRKSETKMEKGYFEEAIQFIQDFYDKPVRSALTEGTCAANSVDCNNLGQQ